VIHFHDFSTFWLWGFLVQTVLRCLGKKIFITFHGWEGHVPPRRGTIIKRKICEFLTTANICAGHFIEKWYGTRADLITYGGCTVPPHPDSPPIRKNGLFIGRLEDDTGIREYILAWKTVQEQFPDLELLVCGDGSLQQELLELTEKNRISNIRFLGFVRQPEKLLATSAFVFTSGFLGILEAFASQTPVIATYDNPLKKDYLTMLPDSDTMLWIAADLPEIIAAVQEIINMNISEKTAAAYTFARQNSWQKVADNYLQLYQQHGCHV
jgi:glycosyltransferase involved in cell wall biosynthesis